MAGLLLFEFTKDQAKSKEKICDYSNSHISIKAILFSAGLVLLLLYALFSSANSNADGQRLLASDNNHSVELFIKNKKPVYLEIDTHNLSSQIHGKIPIRFYSRFDQANFKTDDSEGWEIYWHDRKTRVIEDGKAIDSNSDRYLLLKLDTTDEMVGKKVRVLLEKEENLSRAAAVGAFVPQILPIIAMNAVTWQPHSFWPSLLRWNYLLLEIDILRATRNLIQNRVFEDSSTLFAQCSADFVEGFVAYSLSNFGGEVTGDPDRPSAEEVRNAEARGDRIRQNIINRSRSETFRLYIRSSATNRMLDCISAVVANALKFMHHQGRLHEVFGKWPMLDTLNDETLDAIAMLMVGYGFNLIGNVPGDTLALLRSELGFSSMEGLAGGFNSAFRISIQYTIHNGYMKFFKARGWDAPSAYALSAGTGLLEIGYRFYQVKKMIPTGEDERFDPLNLDLQHQISSIGERAEAITSSGYQLIPLPENIKQYAVPVAAVTILPMISYYVLDGALNYYATGGLNIAVQKALTSATNGLVLGALAYVILPHVKEYGAWLTQLAADKLISWTDSEKDSWIGYFAARDTQYKIRVVIVN